MRLGFREWLTGHLAAFLSQPLAHYEQRGRNDIENLCRLARKGDVLLVEGDLRVSMVIKYLTQSTWSHAAIYVGDELLRRGPELRRRTLETFGELDARHLVVEALFHGVVVSPLCKYRDLNIRLCRPHRLRAEDLAVIMNDAVGAIGWRYDLRNIIDLALLSLWPRPAPSDGAPLRLGSGKPTEVMCTSLLGRLFHRVGFPVLPTVTFPEGTPGRLSGGRRTLTSIVRRRRTSYDAVFRRRHPTLLQPRDFDLSPHFEIVKFNHVEQHDFDYQLIEWADDAARDVTDEVA